QPVRGTTDAWNGLSHTSSLLNSTIPAGFTPKMQSEVEIPETMAWKRESVFRQRSTQILLLFFLFSVPLVNPWVRGDGVGYYAYIRSLLVEHKLDFENDWRTANKTFSQPKLSADGSIDAKQYTTTGYLNNHFAVGPSILWA